MKNRQLSQPLFVIMSFILCLSLLFVVTMPATLADRLSFTLPATLLGFFGGKALSGNSRRTWVDLAWLAGLNLLCAFVGIFFEVINKAGFLVPTSLFAGAVSLVAFLYLPKPNRYPAVRFDFDSLLETNCPPAIYKLRDYRYLSGDETSLIHNAAKRGAVISGTSAIVVFFLYAYLENTNSALGLKTVYVDWLGALCLSGLLVVFCIYELFIFKQYELAGKGQLSVIEKMLPRDPALTEIVRLWTKQRPLLVVDAHQIVRIAELWSSYERAGVFAKSLEARPSAEPKEEPQGT